MTLTQVDILSVNAAVVTDTVNQATAILTSLSLLQLVGLAFAGSLSFGLIFGAIYTILSSSADGEPEAKESETEEASAEESEIVDDDPDVGEEPETDSDAGPSPDDAGEQTDESTDPDPDEITLDIDSENEERVMDDVSEKQLSSLAPEYVSEDDDHYEYLRVGKKFMRSYFISDWPEVMTDGHLEDIFTDTSNDIDVSVHVDPVETEMAKATLREEVRELKADLELAAEDNRSLDVQDLNKKMQDYESMRKAVRDGEAEMHDVGMYVTIVADNQRELNEMSDEVEKDLRNVGLKPILSTKKQKDTHRAVTPVAKDDVQKRRSMMGGAVGAMMPFSSGTLIQDQGIPIGEHADNSSPIIYDRFENDQGYNWLTIGNIGAGKSFSTKVHLNRRRLYDKDTIIVMLDPLQGFAGINEALDGDHVLVGGDYGLNPLELKKVPDEVLEENPQLDPGGAKLKDLKAFFESFFQARGDELGEKWDTLQRAAKEAYSRRGIDLDDPSTHGRDNPTIQDDIVPVLFEMVTHIEEHTILNDLVDDEEKVEDVLEKASEVTEEEEQRAAHLLLAMEPFLEGGELENLGGESQFDIQNEDVVWLDLQQQEARSGLGLMMNLLFSSVYERAKQSDKKIIFAIDEARYIMRDKAALEFLEQAVRHSRHYDLSIQFITQTVDEFFQHSEAEAIADQCDHKMFFQTEGMDEEIASKVGMNAVQAQFVRNATPGDKERGYSEGAFGVSGEGWYPVHVRARETEAAVADMEPDTDIHEALPGMSDDAEVPERVKKLRRHLKEKYQNNVQVDLAPEKIVPEVTVETDDGEKARVDQSALRGKDTGEVLERIEQAVEGSAPSDD